MLTAPNMAFLFGIMMSYEHFTEICQFKKFSTYKNIPLQSMLQTCLSSRMFF